MRYLPLASLACILAGCGIFGSSDSKPESQPAATAADPREAEKADLRLKISAKQQDLDQANSDLTKIAAERDQLAGQPASETKTNRLIELQRLENDSKQKKASLTDDIAQLQAQLNGTPASAKPAKPVDPLDDVLASNDAKEKEEAERRRKQAEEAAAADKSRLAQADAARKAEEEERAKQKVEGGRLAMGDDAAPFEERWADAIRKIQAELQKYKRW